MHCGYLEYNPGFFPLFMERNLLGRVAVIILSYWEKESTLGVWMDGICLKEKSLAGGNKVCEYICYIIYIMFLSLFQQIH